MHKTVTNQIGSGGTDVMRNHAPRCKDLIIVAGPMLTVSLRVTLSDSTVPVQLLSSSTGDVWVVPNVYERIDVDNPGLAGASYTLQYR